MLKQFILALIAAGWSKISEDTVTIEHGDELYEVRGFEHGGKLYADATAEKQFGENTQSFTLSPDEFVMQEGQTPEEFALYVADEVKCQTGPDNFRTESKLDRLVSGLLD